MILHWRLSLIALFFYCLAYAGNPLDSLTSELQKASGRKKTEILIKLGVELRADAPDKSEYYFSEAINVLKKEPDEELSMKARIGLGKTYLKNDKREQGLRLFEEVLKEGQRLKNDRQIIEASHVLAKYYSSREPDRSVAYTLIAEKAARIQNDEAQLATTYNYRGQAYFAKSNYRIAADCFEKSRNFYGSAGDKLGEAGMTMNLGIIYYKMNDYPNSLLNYQKAYEKFRYDKDTMNMANALVNIGMSQREIGELKKAKENYLEAEKYYQYLNDSSSLAMIYENESILESELDNRPLALKLMLRALAIREKMSPTGRDLVITYDNICNMMTDIMQLEQARYYYSKANSMAKKLGNTDLESGTYYHYSGILEKENKLDSAIYYQKLSLKLNEKNADEGSISGNYSLLGNYYYKLKRTDEALQYFLRSMEIKLKLGDRLNLGGTQSNIGSIYLEKKNYRKALGYYLEALKIFNETGVKQQMESIYHSMARCYFELGNTGEAYKYEVIYSRIKDSLYNLDISKQLVEMSERFESEKKKKEIALLKKEAEVKNLELISRANDIKKQRLILAISISGLLIFIFLSVMVYRALKQNQRSKAEISHQKNLIEEKQKEILDSIHYAKRIQKAHLPSDWSVDSDLKRMKG